MRARLESPKPFRDQDQVTLTGTRTVENSVGMVTVIPIMAAVAVTMNLDVTTVTAEADPEVGQLTDIDAVNVVEATTSMPDPAIAPPTDAVSLVSDDPIATNTE